MGLVENLVPSECLRHFHRPAPDDAHDFYTPACAHSGSWFVAVMAHRGGMWFLDLVDDSGPEPAVECLATGTDGVDDWRPLWDDAVDNLRDAARGVRAPKEPGA